MDVFIVVVTYNGKQWYDRCFSSLRTSSLPLEVVVVDNASDDDTISYISNNYPEIYLIASDRNLGFGRGNNRGIKYSIDRGADYIFLLNQDAWIEEDTIDKLVDIHQRNPQFGILSPVHVNVDKTGIEKLLLNRLCDFRVTDSSLWNDLFFKKLKDVYETKYVNAAAWFIPTKVVDVIGGFDPFFIHYGEDDNYLNRLFFHGYKVGICPNITIVHDADRSRIRYEDNEEDILWRIEYSNINRKFNFNRELLTALTKFITNNLKFNFKRSWFWGRKFVFLYKHKKELRISINTNRQKGRSWLY